MAKVRDYPSITITVEEYEGKKVFVLDGLRFPTLPAGVLVENDLVFAKLEITHNDKSVVDGFVMVHDDFPNGSPGSPPSFRIANMELRDSNLLEAVSFEVGDIIVFTGLPVYFPMRFVHRLADLLQTQTEFVRTVHKMRSDYARNMKKEMTHKEICRYIDSMTELRLTLHTLPGWPPVIDLQASKL